MSSTDRQNRLLLAEDWKRVYQSYKNAEFKSYDFDTIRRTMIQYIRQNYPEDFNDYIESSEYLALIDLIAYLGQNLAFRTDLNARGEVAKAKSYLDSVKDKYYAEIKLRPGINPEQQKATDVLNRYNEEQAATKVNQDRFISQTDELLDILKVNQEK